MKLTNGYKILAIYLTAYSISFLATVFCFLIHGNGGEANIVMVIAHEYLGFAGMFVLFMFCSTGVVAITKYVGSSDNYKHSYMASTLALFATLVYIMLAINDVFVILFEFSLFPSIFYLRIFVIGSFLFSGIFFKFFKTFKF